MILRRLKMDMQVHKKIVILCIQMIIIVVVGMNLIYAKNSCVPMEISLEKWSSDYISYENSSWIVEEGDVGLNGPVDIIYGPFIELKKGHYTVNVEYECDEDQYFTPRVHGIESNYLEESSIDARLSRMQTAVGYDFRLTKDVNDFEIVVKYNGKGNLEIKRITITSNVNAEKKALGVLIVSFVTANIVLFHFEYFKKEKNVILALIGIACLVTIPLLMPGLASGADAGHDLDYHLNRIEGIAEELKLANFPVRITSRFFDGYGYPTSIYYGDILLYIPALLRVCGFSIVASYKLYVLFINIGTTLISYFCSYKIFKNKGIAFAITSAYVTSAYRLVNLYVRAAVGEYTAMMFLPLIATAIYLINVDAGENWKKNALILATGMSGLITCHILTTEMVVIVLVVVCIVMWKKMFERNRLLTYITAVAETLLLTAWYLVPFTDYYINVKVRINDIVDDTVQVIQSAGAFISQYFSFFQNPFGEGQATTGIAKRMMMTPGLGLMLAAICAAVLWCQGKADKKIKRMLVASLVSLFVASNLFPWNNLAANWEIGNFLAQIQFPWRYLAVATVFLTLLWGVMLQKYFSEARVYIICAICFFSTAAFVSSYCDNATTIVDYYDNADLYTYRVGKGEYLRSDSDVWNANRQLALSEGIELAEILHKNGSDMSIHCKTTTGGDVEIPLFNYKGYCAVDENGNSLAIEDGANNVVRVRLPENFDGNFFVRFNSPWYWRGAEIISLLAIFVLFGGWVNQMIVKKRKVW